jgi:hypothetical protein
MRIGKKTRKEETDAGACSFISFIGIDIATFTVVCTRYQKDTYTIALMPAVGGLAAIHLFETTLARRRGYRTRLLAYG